MVSTVLALSLISMNPSSVTFNFLSDGSAVFSRAGKAAIVSPAEGLWSISTRWEEGVPAAWVHLKPIKLSKSGDWIQASGAFQLEQGVLEVRDSYRVEGDKVRGIRRFEWKGTVPLEKCTLSIRWQTPNEGNMKPLLPGISYFGNPMGKGTKSCVAIQDMTPGEASQYEEHRYSMPFVSLENSRVGAAFHTIPSMPAGANKSDQWWTLGMIAGKDHHEFRSLTGPCMSNGLSNVVKARQDRFMEYPNTWLTLQPGMIIEKTFLLEAFPVSQKGSGFITPIETSLSEFQPYGLAGLPSYDSIIKAKLKFAESRWREGKTPGFEMYPDYVSGTNYVMGWCGQAEALGYALLALDSRFPDTRSRQRVQGSLDLLSEAPFNEHGFMLAYSVEKGSWSQQDFVSQGQAMESITRAIVLGKKKGLDTKKWEAFAKRACEYHADRILKEGWRPVSTNEGFLVSPLLRGTQLFKDKRFLQAGLKAADHYAKRHISMDEPYWGGTLDASCEDKEGAWAGFQAFLAAYDATKDRKYLGYAEHAMYVALSYTMVWDIDLPAGRLKDHAFKSRGWTIVSAQNQHLDVFGVYYTPEVYRMGQLLKKPHLQELAKVMYRSCGQLIDPFGSQGEQIQHTNFAQAGDMSDVYKLRGGYSEGWTVFWITAHFLHAAGRFEEMKVKID